ncbi:SIMPL domain-containing protein [[Pseudomonas] carboxydohydrogena]|uniref:SIMPL domain-containing protein n=1 Tax=Afipia carboxydohydrogena TaxID=290 RepID=A0ABY8BU70_AFICR|nr:SIMPL domain-containing protein [[Pseudomonas] carboxydohydrogena]WEF51857.1 SIMPL domain-containing protein [[Pseudomonas] carboxydohydrogena]
MRCLVAAACLALASPAFAEALPPAISVSGQATVSAAPDLAEIEAGVTTEAKTARAASEANAKAMNAVFTALKGTGIAQKDVQTSQISLQPQMTSRNNSSAPPQITGYRATNRVSITLRDLAKIGDTLDALVASGANDIGGIGFSVSQSSKLLDEARAKALEDAHRKAAIYTQSAGVTLGGPLNISEGGAPPPMAFRTMKASMDAAPTPIAAGEQTLRVSVQVTYEIKPKTP